MTAGPIFERIVVLTGAGISAESGVATFRDKDGIWSKYDLRDVATPEGFARNPRLVHDFYNARRRAHAAIKPNAAHHALARLERELARPGDNRHPEYRCSARGGGLAKPHSYARRAHEGAMRLLRCAPRLERGYRHQTRPVLRAIKPAACAQMSSGSARCRTGWTRSRR